MQEIIADEALFRELKDRFGSSWGFGEYFTGGMGAEAIRELLRSRGPRRRGGRRCARRSRPPRARSRPARSSG